jgi:hypothetical protein
MIKEHDSVVLTADIEPVKLVAGDSGVVVHVHGRGAAYEVEFLTMTGQTFAIATVLASQLRPVGTDDLSHARKIDGPRSNWPAQS